MKKLNIVYAYMCEPRFEVPMPGCDALAVWTTTEEPDADIVVYMNGYSYNPRRAINASAVRILYTYEPLTVYPRQFLRGFWAPFDFVLTWCETLVEQGTPFVRFPSLYYDFPFGAAHGVVGNPGLPTNWQAKRKAICQVAGNKHSLVQSELYSQRRAMARWFGKHGSLEMDTYGVPPMPVPNYCGHTPDKLETLSRYRFALCTENDRHPFWSRGYVTEKIVDCFYAFTVPVYLGAADIETHIPPECFIDLRRFASLSELDTFLSDMSDDVYLGYLTAIERFLKEYNAPQKHSCSRLYEKAMELASATPSPSSECDLFGFWQKASFVEKVGCTLMSGALPLYQKLRRARYSGEG